MFDSMNWPQFYLKPQTHVSLGDLLKVPQF